MKTQLKNRGNNGSFGNNGNGNGSDSNDEEEYHPNGLKKVAFMTAEEKKQEIMRRRKLLYGVKDIEKLIS